MNARPCRAVHYISALHSFSMAASKPEALTSANIMVRRLGYKPRHPPFAAIGGKMAESEGFEPSYPLRSNALSRRALSTTQPTLLKKF